MTIKGTVDCLPCHSWYSCWPKGSVPVKQPPSPDGCPIPYDVENDEYPFCKPGAVSFSLLDEEQTSCCYKSNTFCD
jgi:hypothetical protein